MNRNNFIILINEHKFTKGVELGVAAGCFSEILASSNLSELVLVDKWNDHHNENEKICVINKFKDDSRIKIMHSLFSDAVKEFSDGYFDFIYIDGYAHTGQDSGQTLDMWWPKLSNGGFFGGHDYHSDWKPTIISVDNFCNKHNLKIQLTSEERYPSWYLFKP